MNRFVSCGQEVAGDERRPATLTDAELIARSRTDPEQFGIIFERHFDAVYAYACRRIGSSLAEELTAEAFTVAFASRARFDLQRITARPWLFGIATNLLRRHYRLERRQLRAYAREGLDPAAGPDLSAILNRVDAHSARARLAAGLASLSGRDRDALLLYAWADLSYQEIADALRIPVGTVRSRIHRARRVMRKQLGTEHALADTPATLPALKEI